MSIKVDSPLIYHGTRIVNLLLLNFLWVLGCIPVITAGASTIAAFEITLKMVEERESSSVFLPFWRAFASNLKHGIPLTVIFGVVCYGIWLDWQLFENLEGNTIGFLIIAMAAAAILLVHYMYIFPLEARYQNSLIRSLVNSRKIFFRFFVRTLGLIGILIIQFLLFTQIHAILLYIGLFCLPILMIYTTSQVIMPIFRKIEKDTGASDGFAAGGEPVL